MGRIVVLTNFCRGKTTGPGQGVPLGGHHCSQEAGDHVDPGGVLEASLDLRPPSVAWELAQGPFNPDPE